MLKRSVNCEQKTFVSSINKLESAQELHKGIKFLNLKFHEEMEIEYEIL